MATYGAGIIGLGWVGFLNDIGERPRPAISQPRYDLDDPDRPNPPLDPERRLHLHERPGGEGLPSTYADALWDRPEIELVAAAERNPRRLEAFRQRYGAEATYTDAEAMLREQSLDIVAICTNVTGRADLTCLAVENGVKAVMAEKPISHTLADADRMVRTCAEAGVVLNGGLTTSTHPSFATAKGLIGDGAIGDVVSMETTGPHAQSQMWSYFVDSPPSWVSGFGDRPRRQTGSDEFVGEGIMVTEDGLMVHFRHGAPGVRVAGSRGEIVFDTYSAWRLWRHIDGLPEDRTVEMPWPGPQCPSGDQLPVPPFSAVWAVADVVDCLEGRLDEPKNSGRRVATALEVEIALKLSSARGGERVGLPLEDRSLRLNYDWFR